MQPVVSLPSDPAAIAEARQIVADLIAPAPWDVCIALAKRLHAMCAIPRDAVSGAEDLAMVYETRAAILIEHPEDIARHAVDTWPRTAGGRWYPTVAELRDHCLAMSLTRRQLVTAVTEAIGRAERGEELPGQRPSDPERAERLGAEITGFAKEMRSVVQARRDDEARKAAEQRRAAGPDYATAEGALPVTRNTEMVKSALRLEAERQKRSAP